MEDRRIRAVSGGGVERGLTLVELLVILTIVSLAAGVVVMNAPPPRARAADEAERLAAKLEAGIEASILGGVGLGVELSADSVAFYQYERGAWTPAELPTVKPGRFPGDLSVVIDIKDAALNNEPPLDKERDGRVHPKIFLSPTGETTPVTVRFTARGKSVSLELSADGEVRLVRSDD